MSEAWKEYELFVKEVYEDLNSIDGLEDVNIQHNVILQGKARPHQIDIYWEFKKAGIPFRVVVECKGLGRPTEAKEIEAFHTVLEDLNNPIGIFAAKHGFQQGAKDVAKFYGIQIMDIHGPDDEDWNGYIKTINIALALRLIKNIRVRTDIDPKSAEEYGIQEVSFYGHEGNEIFVVEGTLRQSLSDIGKHLPGDKEGKDFVVYYQYEDAYIEYDEKRLKLKGIEFVYDVEVFHDTIFVDVGRQIKAFVKDIIKDDTKIIDNQGRVN